MLDIRRKIVELKEKAVQLLKNFKGDNYVFGIGKLDEIS